MGPRPPLARRGPSRRHPGQDQNLPVSSIIKFFVASDNAAAAGVGEGGPGPAFESATYGNFDVWSTLEEWECLLMDRELAALIADGGRMSSAATTHLWSSSSLPILRRH